MAPRGPAAAAAATSRVRSAAGCRAAARGARRPTSWTRGGKRRRRWRARSRSPGAEALATRRDVRRQATVDDAAATTRAWRTAPRTRRLARGAESSWCAAKLVEQRPLRAPPTTRTPPPPALGSSARPTCGAQLRARALARAEQRAKRAAAATATTDAASAPARRWRTRSGGAGGARRDARLAALEARERATRRRRPPRRGNAAAVARRQENCAPRAPNCAPNCARLRPRARMCAARARGWRPAHRRPSGVGAPRARPGAARCSFRPALDRRRSAPRDGDRRRVAYAHAEKVYR